MKYLIANIISHLYLGINRFSVNKDGLLLALLFCFVHSIGYGKIGWVDPIPFIAPIKERVIHHFSPSSREPDRNYLRDTTAKPLRMKKSPPHIDRVYLTDHQTLVEEILSKKTDVLMEGVIQREDIEAFERTQMDKRKKREERELELEEIFEAPIVEAEKIQTDSGRRFDAKEIIPLLLEKAFTESSGDITAETMDEQSINNQNNE